MAVDEPWPTPNVFAPQNSTVLINCTTTSDSPLWSIDLASDGSNSQLQFSNRAEDLNAHGVYELPTINETGMLPTLRLLINNTARNNGTDIVCDDGNNLFEPLCMCMVCILSNGMKCCYSILMCHNINNYIYLILEPAEFTFVKHQPKFQNIHFCLR